jgi:hypothetical protein
MSRWRWIFVTAWLSLLFAADGRATIVEIGFSGHVQPERRSLALPPQLAGSIALGDPVTGRFRWDSEAFPESLRPGEGWYPAELFEVTVAGISFVADPDGPAARVQILNDFTLGTHPQGTDRILVQRFFTGPWEDPARAIGPSFMELFFEDPSKTILDSNALPEAFPPLAAFNAPFGEIEAEQDVTKPPMTLYIGFTIEEVHLPEPAGLLLVEALVILGLSGARHFG